MTRRAIFAVDPGGSTGVAWGIFQDDAETVKVSMRERTHSDSVTFSSGRVEGKNPAKFQAIIREHVGNVIEYFNWFVAEAYMPEYERDGLPLEFVCEHFVLTPSPRHKPGVEGIFPAFLVGALIQAMDVEEIILQTASTGMKWNVRKHLDAYDAWIVGKEHERSAFAHIAGRLHSVLR